MRPLLALCALTCVIAGCSVSGDPAPTHAGTYPGGMGTPDCPASWFRGAGAVARFTCTPAGYRVAFTKSGMESSLSLVETAAVMRIDAVVRSIPHEGGLAEPGIACLFDREHGWRVQLSARSRWAIVAFGTESAIESGASKALRPLPQGNHVVLTCDASGSETRLSFTVNGTVVATGVRVGPVARFISFGIWAAGDPGEAVLVTRMDATTR